MKVCMSMSCAQQQGCTAGCEFSFCACFRVMARMVVGPSLLCLCTSHWSVDSEFQGLSPFFWGGGLCLYLFVVLSLFFFFMVTAYVTPAGASCRLAS